MDPKKIQEQIDKIQSSRTFANKGQLRRLLEILHQNIDSQGELKPPGVIQQLWPDETRTKRAADVATEMNRLRHALEDYYESEGKNDEILIRLPNRSVAAANSASEKRWIVARARGEKEATEEHPLAPATRASKRRRLLAYVGIAGAAIAALGYAGIRLLASDEPKLARVEGSTLVIMNAEGKDLWKKTFAEGISPEAYFGQASRLGVWFADLEGRGHPSVLFDYLPGDAQRQSSTLICYSDRGKEKWRWTPGRDLPELAGDVATYKISALGVLPATQKRPPRIVVSSSHAVWWPNQIAILDTNGKLVSQYWHSGHLDNMVLADLDGDGKEEIVAAGVNNDYRQATLVVLDPDRVFGESAEVRDQFQIHGMGAAQERLRLLFPRSDLNTALYSYNIAGDLSVTQSSIRLTVWECIIPAGCQVWYEFDKSLHLVSAYPGEDFRSSHVRFYQNRKDAHVFTGEEQAAFEKVRCLVGCKTEYVTVGIP
jgi:hypothetical protein